MLSAGLICIYGSPWCLPASMGTSWLLTVYINDCKYLMTKELKSRCKYFDKIKSSRDGKRETQTPKKKKERKNNNKQLHQQQQHRKKNLVPTATTATTSLPPAALPVCSDSRNGPVHQSEGRDSTGKKRCLCSAAPRAAAKLACSRRLSVCLMSNVWLWMIHGQV